MNTHVCCRPARSVVCRARTAVVVRASKVTHSSMTQRSALDPERAGRCNVLGRQQRKPQLTRLAASQDFSASRREAVAAGTAVVLASLVNVAPAQAFLGFGEGKQREEAYKAETVSVPSREACASSA